jgi:hypothetical protein
MDAVYYLVHISNNEFLHRSKQLKCMGCDSANSKDKFPGVYFTLVTKFNIDTEMLFPGKYIYIFSKTLLQQNNYHMNIQDANGMINEHITFFPWNAEQCISKINNDPMKFHMNEVVFHNDVDMKFCCKMMKKKPGISINTILPRKPMKTKMNLDMTKLPFYCYVNEDVYTGSPVPPKSSLLWYKMLSRVAGLKTLPGEHKTKQEYISAIRRRARCMCKHREKQNLEILHKWTANI